MQSRGLLLKQVTLLDKVVKIEEGRLKSELHTSPWFQPWVILQSTIYILQLIYILQSILSSPCLLSRGTFYNLQSPFFNFLTTTQPISDEVALRIALAARAIPDISVRDLIEALQTEFDGEITCESLEKITVTQLKRSFGNIYEVDDGEWEGEDLTRAGFLH